MFSSQWEIWDVLTDEECKTDAILTSISEENVSKAEEHSNTNNTNSSSASKTCTQTPPGESFNTSYLRLLNEEINKECPENSEPLFSRIYNTTKNILNNFNAETGTQFETTGHEERKHKSSAGSTITAENNTKVHDNEIKNIHKTADRNGSKENCCLGASNIINENDIIITFNSDEVGDLTKETIKTINESECIKDLNKKKPDEYGEQTKRTTEANENKKEFLKGKQSYNESSKNKNPQHTHEPFFHEDPNIKTLEDSLKYFNLKSSLNFIEMSLEDVKKHKKSKKSHQSELKQFDKEIQRLSFTFHPDKVKNRGGSEEDIAIAQKLQTVLNVTRTVLNVLHEAFLEDLNMDHKYGYYTKLNISSLANEDEIKNHVYEVIFKISFISQIKQQNIIAEIREFISESQSCVKNFFDNKVQEFETCRNSAFFHLKKCIQGYKKLLAEFKAVEEECRNENLDNITFSLKRMSSGCSRNLYMLKDIKKIAKKSLTGACIFFSTNEYIDDYYVTPFAVYINIIIMCNVMLKNGNQSFWGHLQFKNPEPAYNHSTSFMLYLFYLASVFSGNSQFKYIVERTLGPTNLSHEEIKREFFAHLKQTNEFLEDKFKVADYYTENSHGNPLIDEYKKCIQMMADFKMKERELKIDIEKLASRNQEIEDKYDKAMEECQKLNDEFEKRLEQCKLLREKTAASLA